MTDADISVTVVITAYKLEAYLPSCLDCLFAQTYEAFDVLIFDDASPDRTLDIALAYQARSPGRFRVFELPENTGSAAGVRNIALDSGEIRGDYVLFLDGDDLLESDMIEKLVNAACANDADIAICAFDRLYEDTGRSSKPELGWLAGGRVIRPEAGDLAYINTSLWNKLIRRELIGDKHLPEISVGDDALFLLALYEKCERFAFVEEPLLHYRVWANSVISRTNMRDIEKFGNEFVRLYSSIHTQPMRDTVAVAAFVHMGLSMAMRAAANPNTPIRGFTAWAGNMFRVNFDDFKGVVLLSMRSLFKRKGGALIWLSKWAYRLGLAPVMLALMRVFSRRMSKRALW